MENDFITRYNQPQHSVALSPPKQTAIQSWREQPERYYATLPTTTPRKMIEADTPTLWDIRQRLGHPAAVAILVNAFIHAAKLVNLDKNLTIEQIGEAANDTLEAHGYLKVEEVKFLLKRALRTQNVYGRLDYNVLMNWVEQYDAERTEEAMRLSDQEASQALNGITEQEGAVSYEEYIAALELRAETDKDAAALLGEIRNPPKQGITFLSSEEREKNDHDFKLRYFEYQMRKKQ